MSSALIKKAKKPPISIRRDQTVIDAVRTMAEMRVGAVLVLDDGWPAGIFTERDIMIKVVLEGRDPDRTLIADVMTSPVLSVHESASPQEAVRLMMSRHIRHLPLVDDRGVVQGVLSMRHLVGDELDELQTSVRSLENYAGYDGATG